MGNATVQDDHKATIDLDGLGWEELVHRAAERKARVKAIMAAKAGPLPRCADLHPADAVFDCQMKARDRRRDYVMGLDADQALDLAESAIQYALVDPYMMLLSLPRAELAEVIERFRAADADLLATADELDLAEHNLGGSLVPAVGEDFRYVPPGAA